MAADQLSPLQIAEQVEPAVRDAVIALYRGRSVPEPVRLLIASLVSSAVEWAQSNPLGAPAWDQRLASRANAEAARMGLDESVHGVDAWIAAARAAAHKIAELSTGAAWSLRTRVSQRGAHVARRQTLAPARTVLKARRE